MITVTVCF